MKRENDGVPERWMSNLRSVSVSRRQLQDGLQLPSIFFSPGFGPRLATLKATSLSTRLSADYKRVGKASLNGLELCARHP
jgi:hypothetical protein